MTPRYFMTGLEERPRRIILERRAGRCPQSRRLVGSGDQAEIQRGGVLDRTGPERSAPSARACPQALARRAAARSKGSVCRRVPVAARTAFATAGAIGGTPGSPTPEGGFLEGPMRTSTARGMTLT